MGGLLLATSYRGADREPGVSTIRGEPRAAVVGEPGTVRCCGARELRTHKGAQ